MGKNRWGTRGKLYTLKSRTACQEEGIAYAPLPNGVAGHMVVALTQPDHLGNVMFATV